MTDRNLLKAIHKENRETNRNIQRLINIGLMGLLGNTGHEAKKNHDVAGRRLAKTGLVLVVLSEVLLFISDIIDYKESE